MLRLQDKTIRRSSLFGLFLALGTVGFATGAEIVSESRDSTMTVQLTNLGLHEGYVGGGDGLISFTTTGLTSADDLSYADQYFYGPDSFDRVNVGSSTQTQAVTFEQDLFQLYLFNQSSAAGPASPQVVASSEITYFFSVDESVTAHLSVTYDGATNVGFDQIVLGIWRVGPGSNPEVLETLFSLSSYPDPTGTIDLDIDLVAGERYRIYADGTARSFNGTSPIESLIQLDLSLPNCLADFNDDNIVDFFDISAFLSAFSAQDPSADIIVDGLFDFFDVAFFLQAFSNGCP